MWKRRETEMKIIENKTFGEERALYRSKDILLKNCRFDGEEDGESALKECENASAENCLFNLRYPLWHGKGLRVCESEMTELCRAALWYSSDIVIENSRLHGIKALRECSEVKIDGSDIISPEFGWYVRGIEMKDCTAKSEYFMMRSGNIRFENVKFKGKYSFQYIENAVLENCVFDTKDAFWHAKNVIVRDSTIRGEYLAWYCENVTFERCKIIGTQPLCWCRGLVLKDCEMLETDLSFEMSEVHAVLTAPIISIKNPLSGEISVPSAEEIIIDDEASNCKITQTNVR